MIKFSYVNKLATAAVSASSAVSTLPAANAVNYLKQKVWRSTGCSSEWLKFDLGSASAIRLMAIIGHNLTSGATIHFQMNATDVWTSPSVDITATWNAAMILYEWTADQSYRWIRITIADASNPDGFVEVGVAWGGVETSPTRNARAYRLVPVDPSLIAETADGPEMGAIKTKYNIVDYDFNNVDFSTFKTLWEAVGIMTHFFVVTDYDNGILTDGRHDLTFYGHLDRGPEFDSTYRDRGNVRMSFREAR